MNQLEEQVIDNTAAIQEMINNAKPISALSKLLRDLVGTDLFVIEDKNGDTFHCTAQQLLIVGGGVVIHSGTSTPDLTPPASFEVGDFYKQVIPPSTIVLSFWQYNGTEWVRMENNSLFPIENEYLDISEMLGDQSNQTAGLFQYVADATDDATVSSGFAYYEKLDDSTGDLADYRKLTSQEIADGTSGSQKVKDQVGNEFEAKLAVIYGEGFTATKNPDGSYTLNFVGGSSIVQSVTGDNNNVDQTDPDNPIVKSKPLVTPDTGTEITLYPFGNFCNSASPNLEDTEFTFVLTNGSEPAGENATVLIKTAIGATDFPEVAGAEYVVGAPFEADAVYDMNVWHDSNVVCYTFLRRENWVDPTSEYFITTWKTDNSGGTGSTELSIPITFDVSVDVDWGDGNGWELGITDEVYHDYGTGNEGTYIVKIRGNLSSFSNIFLSGDGNKLIKVNNWGNSKWTQLEYACYNCANLIEIDSTPPDLSLVSSLKNAFNSAVLIDEDFSNWAISTIIDMTDMFYGVTLSTPNYDALLIGWAAQTVKPNVPFDAGNSKYTTGGAAEAARLVLTSSPNNWVITDGGPV